MCPGSPSGAPGTDGDPALGQARRPPRASSASPSSTQEKLAWLSAAVRADRAQRLLDPHPLGDRASTRRVTSSWCRIASAPAAWARALTLNGWRTASTAARKLRRADRVADPQPGQAVALAEGAQDDQVGEVGQQVDGRVGIIVGLELDVGLVEDDRHVGRAAARRRRRSRPPAGGCRSGCSGCRRPAAGSPRVTSAAIASRSWTPPRGQRHADLAGPGQRGQVRVHREEPARRRGSQRRGSQSASAAAQQDLAGTVADGDPAGLGLIALGDPPAQQRRLGSG